MALKLKGSTSGFVGLDAPAVAGNNTLILPESAGSAGQILANDITAGVTTFTQVTVSRNGDLTVPGTISIGGTLTYEDVTSVDSVGIVTARGLSIFGNTTGLNVTSGISTFTGDIFLNSTDKKIYLSNDSDQYITANAASNYIAFAAGNAEKVRISSNGSVGIGTDYLSTNAGTYHKLVVEGDTTSSIAVAKIIRKNSSASNSTYTFEVDSSVHTSNMGSGGAMAVDVYSGRAFTIDGNGKIGIGTDLPHVTGLTISGANARFQLISPTTGGASGDGVIFGLDGSQDYFINNRETGKHIKFFTESTERMRIDSSGNIEIGSAAGTGADFSLLDGMVINAANGRAGLIVNSSSSSDNAYISFGYGSGSGTSHNDQFSAYIGRVGDNTLTFGTNNSIRGAFDSSGNFSVGTTSAVNNSGYGGITLNGTSGSILSFKDSDVEKSRIAVVADNTLSIQSPPGGSGVFRIDQLTADGSGNVTGATERLRIVSGGRLFVGTTGAININGVTTGHTFNQVDDYKWIMGLRCELTNKVGLAIRYAAGGNDHDVILFQKDSTVKFVVHSTGNVANANNSYGQTSDVSLKENIVDANSQWNDIKNVKVRNFNFKAETGLPSHTQIGVVAQEIETTSPKLVTENEEGIKEVGYSVLYMKSVKALQEAMARIETLEAKVAALEGS